MRRRIGHMDPWTLWVSAAWIAALLALVAVWWRGTPGMGFAGRAAALCCAGLFGALGVEFVARWRADWRGRGGEADGPVLREPVRSGTLVRIFLLCLAWAFFTLLLVHFMRVLRGGRLGFRDGLEFWTRLDTKHYLNIARDGYLSEGETARVVELVFLPGYPLLVRLFGIFTEDILHAGLAASGLCFGGAGVFLYLLVRLDGDHETALRTLKYACLMPGAVFFAAPMSESMFFLLSLSCVYACRREKWLCAGLLGGLASFTRTLGLMLLAPVCYELVTGMVKGRGMGWRKITGLLLIPAGFGVYCLISKRVTGGAFTFLTYQREHWNQSLGLFFNTAAYQTENALKYYRQGEYEKLLGLWLSNLVCVFGALGVMLPAAKRLRPSYTAYFIAYYVAAVGPTWLLSGPRYLAAAFPLSMALSAVTEDRRADSVLTALFAMLFALYSYMLAARWQVW